MAIPETILQKPSSLDEEVAKLRLTFPAGKHKVSVEYAGSPAVAADSAVRRVRALR